jgi:hypothetical protein
LPRNRCGRNGRIGCGTPLVFEVAEHVLDLVSLFVEDGVMRDCDVPVGFRWDAGGDAALCEGGAEPVGVVTLVGEKFLATGRAGIISAAPL